MSNSQHHRRRSGVRRAKSRTTDSIPVSGANGASTGRLVLQSGDVFPLWGETIGARVRNLRRALAVVAGDRVTQEDVGAWVGSEQGRAPYYNATVSTWERDETTPDIEQLNALVRAIERMFGARVDPSWLAFGTTCTAPHDDAFGDGAEGEEPRSA